MKRFTIALATLFSLGATIWAANGTLSGAGTEASPFLLEDYADLKSIGTAPYTTSSHYRLAADINAAASRAENCVSGVCAGFVPIANFSGFLHGAGHVITGLTIVRTTTYLYAGLFASTTDAAFIDSLGLVGVDIQGKYNSGALVGTHSGRIRQCYSTGRVRSSYAGGLVGYQGSGSIMHSYSTARVVGTHTAGGLVGVGDALDSSYAAGRVHGAVSQGGLLGNTIRYGGTVAGSYWDRQSSGLDYSDGSADSFGLSTVSMRQAASYAGWDFKDIWALEEDQAPPSLRGVRDAPFALPDTLATLPDTAGGISPALLATLTANDRDPDSAGATLVARWTDSTLHTRVYQVGTLRAGDTLWGSETEVRLRADHAIATYSDLKKIGTDAAYPLYGNYTLAADIDAAASATEKCVDNVCAGFSPIGNVATPFTGSFDGSGFVIRNLHIVADTAAGLFGATGRDASITSLGLENAQVKGSIHVGGIAGVHNGDLFRSYVAGGTIEGHHNVGGIAGHLRGQLSECYTATQVKAFGSYAGGLAGYSVQGRLRDVYAIGSVSAYASVGGILGLASGGSVTRAFANGPVLAVGSMGGLVGYSYNNSTVESSYWSLDKDSLGQELTSAQMREAASFAGWDFNTVWAITTGASYPRLARLREAPIAFATEAAIHPAIPVASGYYAAQPTAALVARWTDLRRPSATHDSLYAYYQIGYPASATDTLWGGIASVAAPMDTIAIATYADLKKIGVDAGYPLEATYELTADIDASASAQENCADSVCAGFAPIGASSFFSGTLLGHGHSIMNLHIQRDTSSYVGLFAVLAPGAQVDSLQLTGFIVYGKSLVGSLAGTNYGNVKTCRAQGLVAGITYHTGGLVGYNVGRLDSCSFQGDVAGDDMTGGLVGSNRGSIRHCYATGSISAQRGNLTGGLVGSNNQKGSISASYATSSVDGYYYAGGLVGDNDGSVDTSYALGRVAGNYSSGALLGFNNGTVRQCFAAGRMEAAFLTQEDAYQSTGNLIGTNGGTQLASYRINPFRAADSMTTAAAYDGWDFSASSPWKIDEGHSFPALRALDNPPTALPNRTTVLPDTGTVPDAALMALLLANDRDPDDATAHLAMRWTDSTQGTRVYQAGTVSGTDTLWGSEAVLRENQIEIANYTDLKKIGVDAAYGLYRDYRLTANIDASASATENCVNNVCAGFAPIGKRDAPFTGTFNGVGHVIHDLVIQRSSADSIGFFGFASGARIDSLALENLYVQGRYRIGGLVGVGLTTQVRHSGVQGIVLGNAYVGGLAGDLISSSIEASYTSVRIQGDDYLGGLAGYAGGTTLQDCYTNGSLQGKTAKGGLVGYARNTTTLHCYVTGPVGTALAGYGSLNSTATYWDKESTHFNSLASDSINGLKTAAMRTAASFVGWDFAKVWTITEGKSYPTLRGLDNAPFAFGTATATLDPATEGYYGGTGVLTARWTLHTALNATRDSVYKTFQIGAIRGSADTLWGGFAQHAMPTISINIASYADLKKIGLDENYPLWATYNLTADINAGLSYREDCSISSGKTYCDGFPPIGAFTGKFHGHGHVIDSLNIDHVNSSYQGLFSKVDQGLVDSLHITHANIIGSSRTGVLAGNNSGTIRHSSASGIIAYGWHYVGGLVGHNDGTIDSSHANVWIKSAADSVGGLVGYNGNNGIIRYSSAQGDIYTGRYAGGLVGVNERGSISFSFATGTADAWIHTAGGLAGFNNGAISQSYATGPAISDGENVGGLVGYHNGTINNSYATGPASGQNNVGGLCGSKGYATVNNSYSTGWVTSSLASAHGGLSGTNYNPSQMASSYWNRESSGQDSTPNLVSSHGLSTAQMTHAQNFAGWDFATIWEIAEGSSYPALRGLDDLPFAFPAQAPAVPTNPTPHGYAMETPTATLVARWTGGRSVNQSRDSLFSEYQVGAQLANNDIVWGSRANLATPLGTIAIANYADLVKIGKSTAYPLDANYRLVADIDGAGASFTPIGPTDSTAFTGSFHGGGHVIRNLYVYKKSNHTGLFGYLRNAVIDSLGLVNAEVHGGGLAGLLAGINDGGTIKNSHTSGRLYGSYIVGGLVGLNNGTIVRSHSSADVENYGTSAGGLVGTLRGSLSESYATGTVRPSADAAVSYYQGGLVGSMNKNAQVRNSYATGAVRGHAYIGGLAGELNFQGGYSIRTSYAAGPLNPLATQVGGLTPSTYSSYLGSVDSSYWNRTITGVDTSFSLARSNGLTTDSMRLRASFVGWDFATVWDIDERVSYPTLQSVNDAPFTFADTLKASGSFASTALLVNDINTENPATTLAVRLDSTAGLSLAAGKITLPTTAQEGDTLRFWYRAGAVNGQDTLWGNTCLSMVIAGPSTIEEPTHSVNSTTIQASLRMEGNRLLLQLNLPRESQAELQLLAPDGTQLAPAQSAIYAAGTHEIPFNLNELPSGTFIAAVRVDGKSIVHQTFHK